MSSSSPIHPGGGAAPGYGQALLDRLLAGTPSNEHPLTYTAELPAQKARHARWPGWAADSLVDALREQGVSEPWSHQTHAADLAAEGNNVVVSTGTASGKSVAYQLPVLTALASDPQATALYLSPTKRSAPTNCAR